LVAREDEAATSVLPLRETMPVPVLRVPLPVWEMLPPAKVLVPVPTLKVLLPVTLVAPFRETLPVPVLKVPELADWSKLPLAMVMPVAPVMAPALLISMLVVSRLKVPDPPPILTKALLLPVLMLVALLVLLLMEVVPVRVRPPVPWSKPVPLLTPTPTMAPAELTVKLPREIELLVLPAIVVLAPARPRVRAFWVVVPTFRPVAVWVSSVRC